MSFDKLFDKGFKKRNRGHFASLVRIALTDHKITSEELQLLHRVADKLQIDVIEFNQIIKNPNQFPINPPSLVEHRHERLYDLVRMVLADPLFGNSENSLLTKLCIGLGFPSDSIERVIAKALESVKNGDDLETFSNQITATYSV
jgi:uncharacterized tellurite resistance protein B-like protein